MWRSAVALVRGSDVAMVYGLVVVVIAVVLAFVSGATHDHVVLQVSTNLVNLRDRPLWVLFASAFVVSSLVGNFTGVGHATALTLGFGLALVSARVAATVGRSEPGRAG